jgi:putative transcriptional regulator
MRRLVASWLLLLCAATALAQSEPAADPPNAILLVAKPTLVDPNFRETVVLVTQARDFSTVGVILNRPTQQKLSELMPGAPGAERYAEPVYFGGPVMRQVVVAVFRSPEPPKAAAFHALKDVYLSMHPLNVEPLLAGAPEHYRLYAGFSGWAPRQLESELARDSWYVLPANEEIVFRKDTSGMWTELLEKARGARTSLQRKNSG